jgi:hypothetical protein
VSDSLLVAAVALVAGLTLAAILYRARRLAAADRRAERLVRDLLTPAELAQLQKHGYLDVPSRAVPGRIYRIPARPGLVTVVEANRPAVRLCLQPARPFPAPEHVVAHKLLLEGAEDEYWRRANRWRALGCPAEPAAPRPDTGDVQSGGELVQSQYSRRT